MKRFTTLRRLISTSCAITAAISISAPLTASAQGDADKPAPPASEPAKKELSFKVGDKAPSIATEGMIFVKGDAVKNVDEAGKVYMIECWATWCGPCIKAIPHVNELHAKYKDKGLVVVGMNVFEDGLEKVKAFVDKQGDEMSYRVAYSGGRKSEFSKTWLEAAGVRGIPHAFFIKDGVLIAKAHPASITEETIEKFLSDDFNPDSYAKEQAAKEAARLAKQKELNDKIMPFIQAEDWEGLKKVVTEELTAEEDKATRDQLLFRAAMNLGDWDFIKTKAANEDNKSRRQRVFGQAGFGAPHGDGAREAATAALEIFTQDKFDQEKNSRNGMIIGLIRLRYLTLAGKKEEAAAMVKTLNETEFDNPQMKARASKILEQVSATLEKGAPLGPVKSFMR